jgi:hypothetical protein
MPIVSSLPMQSASLPGGGQRNKSGTTTMGRRLEAGHDAGRCCIDDSAPAYVGACDCKERRCHAMRACGVRSHARHNLTRQRSAKGAHKPACQGGTKAVHKLSCLHDAHVLYNCTRKVWLHILHNVGGADIGNVAAQKRLHPMQPHLLRTAFICATLLLHVSLTSTWTSLEVMSGPIAPTISEVR